MEFRGTVVRRQYGAGSKSEHDAVMLVTDDGAYRLRRVGGNPFQDPALDQLVGQKIVCEGTLHQSTVLMSSWSPVIEANE